MASETRCDRCGTTIASDLADDLGWSHIDQVAALTMAEDALPLDLCHRCTRALRIWCADSQSEEAQ